MQTLFYFNITGISNCKLFDVDNLSTSSWTTSLFTNILIATSESAERYTITQATSVANSSSLHFVILNIIKTLSTYTIIENFLFKIVTVLTM